MEQKLFVKEIGVYS